MRAVDLIHAKRDGKELLESEIRYLIEGYVSGGIPDYQMSAWAMAVFFRGMTDAETAALTLAIAESGDMVDLSGVRGIKVDKHSTGGVGDTTTLILAPLIACAGVPVAKMSGRGLGHTGGTVDKLESIPGFRVELAQAEFIDQVNQVGAAVISQSGNLAPADKLLYSLRDVTATVESIPLIASSIMSKKIAAGADAIVLDVKTGGGAFMKTLDDSIRLAQAMVGIGAQVGRETVAIVSGMDQPLGNAIGNALEVREAVAVLRGEEGVSPDLIDVSLTLGAHMLRLGGAASSVEDAKTLLRAKLSSGEALRKFAEIIAAQGGAPAFIDEPSQLPSAARIIPVPAPSAGYIGEIRAESLGTSAMRLGAGRAAKDDRIDLAVGIRLHKRIGDRVDAGEPLAELHASDTAGDELIAEVAHAVSRAFTITSGSVSPPPLIHAVVTKDGVQYTH